MTGTWVKIGPHEAALGGLEGVAARLGVTPLEYLRRREADKAARSSRMSFGPSAETEYHNNQRAGLRYAP